MHSGAWLPRSAWTDDESWDRLIDWIGENFSENIDLRLVVTPRLDDRLDSPDGLSRIADDALRQNARGQGIGRNWLPGDGPIFIVWPQESTVRKWVRELAGLPEPELIVLLEQEVPGQRLPTFQGWATAAGAFNAATGENEQPNPELTERLDDILTSHENELALGPASTLLAYPNSAPKLREKLRAVSADYDEEFIVTYAIALGYPGDLQRLRQHFRAARPF
jgi:hypothetical protein